MTGLSTLSTCCSALPAPFMIDRSLPCASHMMKSICLNLPPTRHGMISARETTGTTVNFGFQCARSFRPGLTEFTA